MKIEIWSDVMCPFCYIGKRNFEAAMAQFPHGQQVEVVWKSFQLDPTLPETAGESHEEYLAKRKGLSPEQVKQMPEHVTQYASQVGLHYDFDNSIIVNSRKAHLLIQRAKTQNLGDEMEERLFSAFFVEGKNIADTATLIELGNDIGLNKTQSLEAFTHDQYARQMQEDILEAQQLGVSGVPFFVFDRKYAVSGAQPAEAFLEALNKSFSEWKKANPTTLDIPPGPSCSSDGVCD